MNCDGYLPHLSTEEEGIIRTSAEVQIHRLEYEQNSGLVKVVELAALIRDGALGLFFNSVVESLVIQFLPGLSHLFEIPLFKNSTGDTLSVDLCLEV